MSNDRLHILLVNNYTIRCGITKAIALLANAMVKRGHRVSIYSQSPIPYLLYPLYLIGYQIYKLSLPPNKYPDVPKGTKSLADMYDLDPRVEIIPYNFTDNNLKIQKIRKEIKLLDPDVCAVLLPDGKHLVWAVTLLGSGIPYIYSERHSPYMIETKFGTRQGRLAAMSGADAIHLLLPSFAKTIPDFLAERVQVIPNAVAKPKKLANPRGNSEKRGDSKKERKILLWLGRLHDDLKQCRLALSAFSLLAPKFPDWDLHIAGDGQDRKMIHEYAKSLNLGDRIKFLGDIKKDIYLIYASANAFCFSSRTEGMPNVLLEAMAAGLPCVGFSDCQGVCDLIKDNENGLIAETMSAQAMAEQLEKLMADAKLRENLGNKAKEIANQYSEEKIFADWEDLFRKTASKKGHTIMDSFKEEPFASKARMVARARSEWAMRDFGEPMPDSFHAKILKLYKKIKNYFNK